MKPCESDDPILPNSSVMPAQLAARESSVARASLRELWGIASSILTSLSLFHNLLENEGKDSDGESQS